MTIVVPSIIPKASTNGFSNTSIFFLISVTNPVAIKTETANCQLVLAIVATIHAVSDRNKPKRNKRGNKTRKKAPTAFADNVLKAACGTTAMKNNINPAIAA